MSDSRIDRVLTTWSVDGASPLTRSIAGASTSGIIGDDAQHWSIEPYLPIETVDLIEYLIGRGELSETEVEQFRSFCDNVDSVLHQRMGSSHTKFSNLYASLDPDFDGQVPAGLPSGDQETKAQQLMVLCDEILGTAGYRHLSQQEIEQCVGVTSQWGVPLHVDFELFEHLAVYARGDIVGTRLRRRLRRLYQPERIDVPIYQRMVILFQLSEDDPSEEELRASEFHLRMFKNIPKQDVDMLLPGARVRLSKMDRAKIIVPSLGGLLLSLRKIFQFLLIFAALTLYSTVVLVGLVLAAIGYVVKSVLSYFRTKDRYLLNLTRNLYFQKLDSNAGVAYRMIQQAHRQRSNECVTAYYAILTSDDPISTRRLRRKSERILREAIDIEADFKVDRALDLLCQMQAIAPSDDGKLWQVIQSSPSLREGRA